MKLFSERLLESTKYTLSEKDFIKSFRYKDKTIDEWILLANDAVGYDKRGNPKWCEYLANSEDTFTWAKMYLENKNSI